MWPHFCLPAPPNHTHNSPHPQASRVPIVGCLRVQEAQLAGVAGVLRATPASLWLPAVWAFRAGSNEL